MLLLFYELGLEAQNFVVLVCVDVLELDRVRPVRLAVRFHGRGAAAPSTFTRRKS